MAPAPGGLGAGDGGGSASPLAARSPDSEISSTPREHSDESTVTERTTRGALGSCSAELSRAEPRESSASAIDNGEHAVGLGIGTVGPNVPRAEPSAEPIIGPPSTFAPPCPARVGVGESYRAAVIAGGALSGVCAPITPAGLSSAGLHAPGLAARCCGACSTARAATLPAREPERDPACDAVGVPLGVDSCEGER